VKNTALRPLSDETAQLARGFERVVWEHVPRERNRYADALANRAMDDQGRVEGPGGVGGAGLTSQIDRTGPVQGTLDRQLPSS
jgi:ribonuclease HI